MAWSIQCSNSSCKSQTWANNIVDLIDKHTDENGWFVCGTCGHNGYIENRFNPKEPVHTWEPFFRGVIRLGEPGDAYQPFVFLVSSDPVDKAGDIWFSFYKDFRPTGGRLKIGYAPEGPPVLGVDQILWLLKRLYDIDLIEKTHIEALL